MKKNILWMGAMLMLAVGMGGCSDNDDEIGDITRNDHGVRGGEVYDGWGKPEVDESDPVAVFFRDELHGPYWDDAGNEVKTFFEHSSWDDESCLMINSREEFQDAYMGTKELPEVDFSKYTLLIGKTWGSDSSYKLDDIILEDMTNFYELEAKLLHYVDRWAFCAIVDIYYWRLYPKLEKKNIVLRRTVKDVYGDFDSVVSKYESQNIRPTDALETVTTQEGWIITTYGGVVTKAEFNTQPPSSPEQFFSKTVKTTESNILKFSSSLKNSEINYANYSQFYQGTYIPNTGYTCYFDNNDKLTKIEGIFAPVENLNLTPSISSDEADAIFSHFLNREIKGVMLQITPFYKDGKIDVRLTYMIDDYMGGCFVHYRCFVDAHSGEVLLSEFPQYSIDVEKS